MKLGAILYPTLSLSQWGMSIESNFFSGIWAKPLPIRRLLKEKSLFSALFGSVAALLGGRILLLEKGNLVMDKPHVPGSMDPELEAYFLDAVK